MIAEVRKSKGITPEGQIALYYNIETGDTYVIRGDGRAYTLEDAGQVIDNKVFDREGHLKAIIIKEKED